MSKPRLPRSTASDGEGGTRRSRWATSPVAIAGVVVVLSQASVAIRHFVSTNYYWAAQSTEPSALLRGMMVGGSPSGGGAAAASPLPFAIPEGQPPNLPRILEEPAAGEKNEEEASRGIYGGKGDGKHLGGFTDFDPDGVAPNVWANMLRVFGVKSMMDVGCGRGISTRWFLEHHAKVLCVEGSSDAVRQSFLPPELIVEHDYSRGPWWPMDTYDAAWSVEFLEHVSRQYMSHYMHTLRKAAVVFASSSRWGGWHHVEVHHDEWWIRKFAAYGFVYDDKLTQQVRDWALGEGSGNYTLPNGDKPRPQNVFLSMKVFLNPAVLSLPAHDHLFAEHGCIGDEKPQNQQREGQIRYVPRPCGSGPGGSAESTLPDSYGTLPVDMSMHQRWIDAILPGINLPKK